MYVVYRFDYPALVGFKTHPTQPITQLNVYKI